MNKINIIQFLPYFPPHKGGLETVAEELSYFYVKNNFGEVINVIFNGGQDTSKIEESLLIKNKSGKIIGYHNNGYKVYLLPSFDIISNFPVPKFWKKIFWEILFLHELRNGIIQTHTRFFLSSFLGGVFSKITKQKWVHIEHGSDYVKLSNNLKSKISYLYDRVIGKWIFRYAYKIVAISEGCKNFIQRGFVNREIEVIYNGINFVPGIKIENNNIIKIGFVGRLVKLKGVDLLIEAFKNLEKKYPNIVLEIAGDGDERKKLEDLAGINNNITFLGMLSREKVKDFLGSCDILVNPSYQEGLPTVVLEGLLSSCVVIASDVGGTKEISTCEDLIIIQKGDIESLISGIEKGIFSYRDVGGKSVEYVKNKFNWEENIRKYFSLYNKL
ncbi:MAG: glycosyltransferase family 4 protein [Candidatus Altimarinota bacterium]